MYSAKYVFMLSLKLFEIWLGLGISECHCPAVENGTICLDTERRILGAHAQRGTFEAETWSCVCLSVCLSHLTSGASVHPENTVVYSAGNAGQTICETARFKSYGVKRKLKS